jgi:hypothetical protein
VQGELAQIVVAVGDVGGGERVVEGVFQHPAGRGPVASEFGVVGGPGEGGDAGAQLRHPVDRPGGLAVPAELGVGVGQYGLRALAVRVGGLGQPGQPYGLGEVVAAGGERGLAGQRGEVAGAQFVGPGERLFGPEVVGRVGGQAGLLDVGGAELGPRLVVAGKALEPGGERPDRAVDGGGRDRDLTGLVSGSLGPDGGGRRDRLAGDQGCAEGQRRGQARHAPDDPDLCGWLHDDPLRIGRGTRRTGSRALRVSSR